MYKKGFSLLELLIVLVILAILGGFLYPSLIAAKEESKRAADSSQLQQLLKAYTMYIGDHEGQVPYAMYNDVKGETNQKVLTSLGLKSNYISWVAFLYPYLKSKEVFWSPASNINQNIFVREGIFRVGSFVQFPSWGYNVCYFSILKDKKIPNILSHSEPINECIIEAPSSTLVFANSTSKNTPERKWVKDNKVELGHYLIVPPSHDMSWQAKTKAYVPSSISYNDLGYLYPRFKNKTVCNVGFADGHVKGISIKDLQNESLWQVKKGTQWNQN